MLQFWLNPYIGAVAKGCVDSKGKPIELGTKGLSVACDSGQNPIYALVEVVVNYAIILLYALAVLAIVVAGIQMITSQGNPDQIKQARARITNVVIGLGLLTSMVIILRILGVTK